MARWTDLATWRGPTGNQGGRMSEYRGVVLHIAEGTFEGTIAWQRNVSAEVSSHFICGKNPGERAQMVDTDVVAWTQMSGNGHWLSIENAGFHGQQLTAAQVEFAAQILARAHRVYGVPLQIATSPTGRGLGHHSMGGAAWGGHFDCPGNPIIAQKPQIIARAQQIVSGVSTSPEDDMTPQELFAAQIAGTKDNPGRTYGQVVVDDWTNGHIRIPGAIAEVKAMLVEIGKRVDISPEELAAIGEQARQGAHAGAVESADDLAAAVVAALPAGTLTRDDVVAAVRSVFAAAGTTPQA